MTDTDPTDSNGEQSTSSQASPGQQDDDDLGSIQTELDSIRSGIGGEDADDSSTDDGESPDIGLSATVSEANSTSQPTTDQNQQTHTTTENAEQPTVDGQAQTEHEQDTTTPELKDRLLKSLKTAGSYAGKMAMGRTDIHSGISGYYYPENKVGPEETVIRADIPSRWGSIGPYSVSFTLILAALLLPLFAVFGLVSGFINSVTPSFITFAALPFAIAWKLSAAVLVIAFGIYLVEKLGRASKWLVLTEEQLIYREHILGENIEKIATRDINKTVTEESFLQKRVNIGNVELYTAATGSKAEPEIEFFNLKETSSWESDISRMKRQAHDDGDRLDD